MEITKTKARIDKISKQQGIKLQTLWDTFFFEHFLMRLSKSSYIDHFVFKGGFLLEYIVGISQRTTMDVDLKYSGEISNDVLLLCINAICNQNIDDDVSYEVIDIADIATEKKYGGKRIRLKGKYSNVRKIFSVDIARDDIVTPKPILQNFVAKTDDTVSFTLQTYNVETILAEKLETLVAKGKSNSRIKDLFDINLLVHKGYNQEIFNAAVINTFHCRQTELSVRVLTEELDFLRNSVRMRELYINYSKKNSFCIGKSFEDCVNSFETVISSIYFNKPYNIGNLSIIMIRHGQDEDDKVGGWSDSNLSKQGVVEVTKLFESIPRNFDLIISSDLPRAKQTAELISNATGIPTIYEPSFRETNNGDFKNMSKVEFLKRYSHFIYSNLKMDERYPNGESPEEFFSRVEDGLKNITTKYQGKKILLVTHGGVITALLCLKNGWTYSNLLKLTPPTASMIEY